MSTRNSGDTGGGWGNHPLVVLVSTLAALVSIIAFVGEYFGGFSGTAPPPPITVPTRVPPSPRASATGAKPQMNPPSIGASVPAPPRERATGGTPAAYLPGSGADGSTLSGESAAGVTPEPYPPGSGADRTDLPGESATSVTPEPYLPGSGADGTDSPAESAVYGAEQPILPVKVSASAHAPPGFDSQGNRTTFEPQNAVDGQDITAWRVPGPGVGDFILLEFAAPILVSSIGLIPGYAKTNSYDGTDRFSQNRRVRQVVIEFSNGAIARATFDDKREMQYKTLSVPIETTFIRITIAETTDHGGRDFAAISEIVVIGRERIQ